MAKGNLVSTARELTEQSAAILAKANRARKDADMLLDELKRLDAANTRRREEVAAQRKREEQMRLQSTHSRAFTMLDDEEKAQIEAALREDRLKAAQREKDTEKESSSPLDGSDLKEAAPKSEIKSDSIETKSQNVAPESVSPINDAAVSDTGKEKEELSADKGTITLNEKPDVPSAEKEQSRGEKEKPVRKPEEKKVEQPKRPAIGQILSRPGDTVVQPSKPVGLAPNVIRAPQPSAQRQGPYGRPAGSQQQGPYGRPAGNMQQGSYGRPAGNQQQSGFGRPAGVSQQGSYGRPSVSQQGGYSRPAGSQQQGPYGRPAGSTQQGGYSRPANGNNAAGASRSQNGPRSQGSGRSKSVAPELLPPMEKERVSNYDPNKKNYVRQHDPEHVTRNKKQQSKQNSRFNGYDDEPIRGGKRARSKKPSVQQMMAPIKIETAYMAGDSITVRDLTEKIGKPAGEIIKKLFMLGNMATINSEIDFDTAQLVCSDFDITLEKKQEQTAEAALVAEDFTDEEENLEPRPPVVTIMGHVDHGKTSLLDYIRKSRVTAGEAGGITQHIGAYMVTMEDGRQITFLDTPGHEAFTAMRARGAQATDIAVLVVAADDSVMPQTVESINHAKAAEVPVIVAINKMDKPDANPERVKQDLTQYGLVCEDWGGETICVPVSALTGQGVDELLEMILLQADMLQLRANPNRLGRGIIVEAKLDKSRGPLATVLLQNGTLRVGDTIIAGMASGKVRALISDRGERVQSAGPGMPVEIMGFDDVPSAGDEMIAVGDDRLGRQVADERREKLRASREATMSKMSMENLFSSIEAGKITTLNLIIKADVQGSVEAVKQAMEKLSNDEVKIRVLHSAAGAITKDDVNLASAFNAIIIGFNIRPDASARDAAEKEKVDVRLYTVIYKAIEDMELAMKGMLEPEYKEVILGHAEVRNVFRITGAGIIAGCYVTDGKVQRNAGVRLLRDNVVVHEGKLSSLRHLKDDVKEMAAGYECGMSLEGHNDIKEGDVVECFVMEEIPR